MTDGNLAGGATRGKVGFVNELVFSRFFAGGGADGRYIVCFVTMGALGVGE